MVEKTCLNKFKQVNLTNLQVRIDEKLMKWEQLLVNHLKVLQNE